MLKLTLEPTEAWNDQLEEFISFDGGTVTLEHSLVSVSKWESKWKVPFMQTIEKGMSQEMLVDYIRFMCIDEDVDQRFPMFLTEKQVNELSDYINDSQTATWFSDTDNNKGRNSEVITSELIYYYMVASGIPFECEHWPLNRLMTLIRVCSEKNKPPEKMSSSALLNQQRELNNARRKALRTKG